MDKLLRNLFHIFFVKPLINLLIGVNIINRENIPEDGQFIIIANHNSHLDTFAILNLFSLKQIHNIKPVAAADYFLQNAITRFISLTLMNIVPIPRDNISRNNNPITKIQEALDDGFSIIIFPEGSRGKPEEISEFKSGIAHIVKKNTHIPILPIFLRGMGRSLPKDEIVIVPFFCNMVIGNTIRFSEESNKAEIMTRLKQEIMALSA